MDELKQMLYRELDELKARGVMSGMELEAIYYITSALKNIHKIEAMRM